MEKLKVVTISVLITCIIANLFYDSWIALAGIGPIFFLVRKEWKKKRKEREVYELEKQFQDAMQFVSSSLLAGVSMENAWREAEREIELLYGTNALIANEWKKINQAIALHIPIEDAFQDFADRTQVEDILTFSDVFSFAKRSGANLIRVIENTTYHMRDKQDLKEEIEVLISAKKLEQRIMDVVPVAILAYLKLTSRDYLKVLYHNTFGILFMSGCLTLYVFFVYLSKQLLNIRM